MACKTTRTVILLLLLCGSKVRRLNCGFNIFRWSWCFWYRYVLIGEAFFKGTYLVPKALATFMRLVLWIST